MSILRFTIGKKLGLSAAAGLLLAGAIVAVQSTSGQKIHAAATEAHDATEVLRLIQSANIILRRMQADTKDIRLSFDAAAVGKIAASVKSDIATAKEAIAKAETVVSDTDGKRLRDLSDRIQAYGNATLALAAVQTREIASLASRNQSSDAWDERVEAVRNALASNAQTRDDALLADVDRNFKDIRAASWQFVATGEAAALDTVDKAVAAGRAALDSLKETVASEASVSIAVGDLRRSFDAFETATRDAITHEQSLSTIVERDSLPAAAAAVDLVRDATASAEQRDDEAATASVEATDFAEDMTFWSVGGLIVILIGSAIFAMLQVARPISKITRSMDLISSGDFESAIPYARRGDEIGEQARVLAFFRDKLAGRKAEMAALADGFEKAVGSVVEMVSAAATELQAAAETLTAAAEQTTSQAAAVAAAAEQAASNVQTVAVATEELAASSREIGQQVAQSTYVASRAVAEADQTNARVTSLKDAAEQVGAVVGMIGDIAAQTNLLALNATIESARAGERRRGFAVVAQEVKGLASQTAKATADISGQIGGMQGSTGEAVSAIVSIGKTISDINHIASAIGAAVEEQNATTVEVARNVQQAAQGTKEVTENIVGVTQAAQHSSAASVQVLSSAGELNKQASILRSQVRSFLDTVRAA